MVWSRTRGAMIHMPRTRHQATRGDITTRSAAAPHSAKHAPPLEKLCLCVVLWPSGVWFCFLIAIPAWRVVCTAVPVRFPAQMASVVPPQSHLTARRIPPRMRTTVWGACWTVALALLFAGGVTTGDAYLFDRLGGFSGGVSLDEPLLPATSLTRNTLGSGRTSTTVTF